MEPNDRQSDPQKQPQAPVGVDALLACLGFLQDLEVQIADDPNRMEEMEDSLRRRGLLLPFAYVDANPADVSVMRIIRMMRRRRLGRVDRIRRAQRVIQEIIRDFEKSESVNIADLHEPGKPPEAS